MKLVLFLLILAVLPLQAWSSCFERYYSTKHLRKKPRQEVRNVIFSSKAEYDPVSESVKDTFRIQFQLVRKKEILLAEGSGTCSESFDPDQNNTCKLTEGKGTIRFKKRGSFSTVGYLDSDVRLKNVTAGAEPGRLVKINAYDKSFGLFKNEKLFNEQCPDIIYFPHKVPLVRLWNEVILHSIRNDLARPTVTARNLYHLSVAMWNAYAIFDHRLPAFELPGYSQTDIQAPRAKSHRQRLQDIAVSYAAYTLLKQRYRLAPGNDADNLPPGDGESGDGKKDQLIDLALERVMKKLGFSASYKPKANEISASATGVSIARRILSSQKNDGSRESINYVSDKKTKLLNGFGDFENTKFLDITQSGIAQPRQWDDETSSFKSPDEFAMEFDIDHWVPLFVPGSIDQGGNDVESRQAPLTLFWGILPTFGDLTSYKTQIPGLYFDPGHHLPKFAKDRDKMIRQNLEVLAFSRLMSPVDLVKAKKDFDRDGEFDPSPGAQWVDISPRAIGNNTLGTNDNKGHKVNPVTGKPYAPHKVLQADFARSIAEFWADGPSSETPPGHWNVIANYVVDQMLRRKQALKWAGRGAALSYSEYVLKMYLALNGGLHDAAVVAWGIKGHEQGNRPITVIRRWAKMAELDPQFASELIAYDPENLKMVTYTHFERGPYGSVLQDKDGNDLKSQVTKLVVRAWRGHSYFGEEGVPNFSFRLRDKLAEEEGEFYERYNRRGSVGGVGWILAENWLPYQKTTFVTPPFPGFVSGHSTFSRAAAEILAGVTGSAFFPGGLGTYKAPRLVFEQGPVNDFEFQWATYFDASDQSGISRLYGGIHAGYDDLPARVIGSKVGIKAFQRADQFFNGNKLESQR